MSTATILPVVSPWRTRSYGTKFFLILLLACGMSLSGFFVEGLVTERADNHQVLNNSAGQSAEQPKEVLGVPLADSYRSMYRSLHYITLFLGLVFLTYFLFEILTRKQVHPAQYALVGVAQIIFYLLLLSFSEHLGFDLSFLIAGAFTVSLFSVNTEWALPRSQAGHSGIRRLRAALRFHLCAAAGGRVRAAGGSAGQFRCGCRRDVCHTQRELVRRCRGTGGSSASASNRNAYLLAGVT